MTKGIIVTGGSHGIGKAICEAFLKEGKQVCVIDIQLPDIQDQNFHFFKGDVKSKLDLEAFIKFSMDKMGRIDVLVNNACYTKKGIISEATYEDFEEVIQVGLQAPYYLSLLTKNELIKNQGHIINIASTRAFQSQPDSETYASAKGGIVALTHSLAMSLAPDVHVNAIAPGWIHTQETIDYDNIDEASIPSGKVGDPSDIAQTVLFLCNQSFINGETIVVDGGMSRQMIYHNDFNWNYKK